VLGFAIVQANLQLTTIIWDSVGNAHPTTDIDGNGIIEGNDVLAIVENFGLVISEFEEGFL